MAYFVQIRPWPLRMESQEQEVTATAWMDCCILPLHRVWRLDTDFPARTSHPAKRSGMADCQPIRSRLSFQRDYLRRFTDKTCHTIFNTTGLTIIIALPHAFGQVGPTLVSAAYTLRSSGTVAPGQIVRLQVTGVQTVLSTPVKASHVPLPTALAGISVTLTQTTHGEVASMPVPLLSIQQTNRCYPSSRKP